MTRMSSHFTGFPVLSEEPSSLCKRLSSISCERDVFSFLHKNTFCVLRFLRSITDWIGFGQGWFGKLDTWCFSKRLLNEFSNWLLSNCRTQLIIPSGPIEIVFQRDLWWWSRRQVWSFIQDFSSFQSFNFWNALSWKCPLKNNCIRSCLRECKSFFDRKINIKPDIPRLDASSMHCARIALDVVQRSQYVQDLCDFRLLDQWARRILLSVLLLKF